MFSHSRWLPDCAAPALHTHPRDGSRGCPTNRCCCPWLWAAESHPSAVCFLEGDRKKFWHFHTKGWWQDPIFRFWVFLFVQAIVSKTAKCYKPVFLSTCGSESVSQLPDARQYAVGYMDSIAMELWGKEHKLIPSRWDVIERGWSAVSGTLK